MKSNSQFTKNKKRRGIAAIWMTFMFLVILGLMAIMVDFGRGFYAVHQVQNAADASALAGARYVPMIGEPTYIGSSPEQIAQEYAQRHLCAKVPVHLNTASTVSPDTLDPIDPYADSLTDDIVIGRYVENSQLFFVDHDTPDSMMVIARRDGTASHPQLGLLFGSIFGINSANFKRVAIAKIINPYGAGVLALGECGCPGIIFGGGGSVDDLTIFGGGSLFVNSPFNPGGNDGAVDQTGNSKVVVNIERMYVVGSIDGSFDYPDDADIHDYTEDIQPESDPYAGLPDHNLDQIRAMEDKGMISDSNSVATYSPGYYSGGLQIFNSGVILEPGDYYLDSIGQAASMTVNGGLITGEGVTLHIIGDADYGVNIGGSANIDISAPTSGTYAGIGIYEKRDPNYNCIQSCLEPWSKAVPISEMNGTGTVNIGGAVYMPQNRLELGGTGDIFMTRTVADRFYIYGDGQKVVDYKGDPKVANKSYLVK